MRMCYKIFRIFLLLLLAPLLFTTSTSAQTTQKIDHFESDIIVRTDGSVEITEQILYDLGAQPLHGIFRDLPRAYTDNGRAFILEPMVEGVTDENGEPYPYTTSRTDQFLRIKIGDPNRTTTGTHTYTITYVVPDVINGFEGRDELYWNVTGHAWPVPIVSVQATVHLPQADVYGEKEAACYTGVRGARQSLCTATVTSDNAFAFNTQQPLAAGEGLTVVARFPKGLVTSPALGAASPAASPFHTILPIALFLLGSFMLFAIWHRYGRDPKGRGTIIAQYEPPDTLSPAEVGTVVDGKMDVRDITGSVINLAVKGYLKIRRTMKDRLLLPDTAEYTFIALRPAAESADLTLVEILTYQAIFAGGAQEIALSDLRNKFYTEVPAINKAGYELTVKKGYFPHNPGLVKTISFITAGVCAYFLFRMGSVFAAATGSKWYLLLIALGPEMIFYAFFMSKRTPKGTLAYEHILGFKDFLRMTEKDRLAFFQSPEKFETLYEKWLPYAIVLQVEEDWAKQFPELHYTPSWYEGGDTLTSLAFAHSLTMMDTSMQSTFVANPRGSGIGGGFSGGGFGGGGGGSW